MQRDISLKVRTNGPSFEVAYATTDPRMALLVTERLTSLFSKASDGRSCIAAQCEAP